MYCNKCGKENTSDSKFCNNCGAQLISDERNMEFVIRGGILEKYNGNEQIVHIPSIVREIGQRAFSNCIIIKEVYLHDNVKIIHDFAFSNCKGLERIYNTESVTELGQQAFQNCIALEEISFISIKALGTNGNPKYSVFDGCANLQIAILPNIDSVPEWTFRNCKKLTQVNLQNVNHIAEEAFENCINLKYIAFPKLINISPRALKGCVSIENMIISEVAKINARQGTVSCGMFGIRSALDSRSPFFQTVQQQMNMYKSNGQCCCCGGSFSGLLNKVCTVCGNEKRLYKYI